MSFDEIIEELKAQKKRKNLLNEDIAKLMDSHKNTVGRVINGENCALYKFLDLVDALGMELSVGEREDIKC